MIEPGDLWVRVLLVGDPEDYERILRDTLDTLIRAGFAVTRPQAIRWALDRIRERPAYQRLLDLQRDTDALKGEF